MTSQTSKRRATHALLLVTALAALAVPVATLALSTDTPDLNSPGRADAPAISSEWERPATPAPVTIVRTPDAQPPAPEHTLSPNPLWEIPLSNLSTTRERPIFSPSRRPPPPLTAAAPPPALAPPPPKPPRVERPQLSLVGTVAGEEESFGIFVDPSTKAAIRLKIGENYQGWKLRTVQGREVMLEHGQQTTILSLPQPGAAALGPPRAQTENVAAQRPADPPPPRDPRR
jgi:general secretion pathway protein N